MSVRHWRVYGVSVQGTSHRATGTPCQDAHAYRVLANGTLVVAVADGAGSASHAHLGAERAVETAVTSLIRRHDEPLPGDDDTSDWDRLLRVTFTQAQTSLFDDATKQGIPIESLATTLVCAIVTDTLVIAGQIGDGLVVIERTSGSMATVVRPTRGEYVNETSFLTQPDALDHLKITSEPSSLTAIVLTTDGLLRLAAKIPSYDPHEPFFRPILGYAAQLDDGVEEQVVNSRLADFLDSARINARTDDDKTLVIARRL